MVEQRDIDENEAERQQDDAEQCLMLCQSCPHQLMVNMVLVRAKDRTVVQQPDDDDPEDIEGGDHEQGCGEQYRIFLISHDVRIVHAEFDKQDTENIAEGQAARVAHENLAVILRLAPDVVIEERNQYPHQSGDENAVDPYLLTEEDIVKTGQGDEHQAGGQAVDTVNQIDGIHREDQDADRQHHPHRHRNLMDAQKAVEVVDIEIGQGEEAGNDNLHEEFHSCPQAEDIVGKPRHVDDRDAHTEENAPGADCDLAALAGVRPDQQCHDGGYKHAGQERYASQPRYGILVYFPGTWCIIKFPLPAERKYLWNHDESAGSTHQEGEQADQNVCQHMSVINSFL